MDLVVQRGFDGFEPDGDGISKVGGANIGGGRSCPPVDARRSAAIAVE